MGGLARRAGVLQEQKDKAGTLTIAGPYELSRPGHKAPAKALKMFTPAYKALGYDLGILTPGEHRDLTLSSQPDRDLPAGWKTLTGSPQTAVFTRQGVRIGVIIFPESNAGSASEENVSTGDALTQCITTMHQDCDLTIGLSGWGWERERRFLAAPGPKVSILLGSGPGPAVRGRLSANGRTFYLRPYTKGRAMSVITIFHPQAAPWKDGWEPNKEIASKLILLDDGVSGDPAMVKLLNSLEN